MKLAELLDEEALGLLKARRHSDGGVSYHGTPETIGYVVSRINLSKANTDNLRFWLRVPEVRIGDLYELRLIKE